MNMILKGNICYSKSPQELCTIDGGYLVCENGISRGVFAQIPDKYKALSVVDYGESIIVPGLCDLHTHAPQYAYRGLGMDLELLDWLETYTYPEESKYADIEYADKAYGQFVDALKKSATTRVCVFATTHIPATTLLMEKLEASGIVSYVGLVSMDRNSPESLRSKNAQEAINTATDWIGQTNGRFNNTKPILTPRFIPVCSDNLMRSLGELRARHSLPVQSHLSENPDEIEWVRKLCPEAASYTNAYKRFGLLGGEDSPAVMAHCVWCSELELELLLDDGVYVAHCPQSNMNITSGIAPIRDYLSRGIRVGLGTDVAGGCHLSVFRAMSDAVQVSKLYSRLIDNDKAPLTFSETFYLATAGGGGFFGKVGSFEAGFEFDAVVLEDSSLPSVKPLTVTERIERIAYLGGDDCVVGKYVRGVGVFAKPDYLVQQA